MSEDLQDWIGWIAICILGAAFIVGVRAWDEHEEAVKQAELARAAFMESCAQEHPLYRCEIEYRSIEK